jgi:hypothetical protein
MSTEETIVEKKLKEYQLVLSLTSAYIITVFAENSDEAEEIAQEYASENLHFARCEVVDIQDCGELETPDERGFLRCQDCNG